MLEDIKEVKNCIGCEIRGRETPAVEIIDKVPLCRKCANIYKNELKM